MKLNLVFWGSACNITKKCININYIRCFIKVMRNREKTGLLSMQFRRLTAFWFWDTDYVYEKNICMLHGRMQRYPHGRMPRYPHDNCSHTGALIPHTEPVIRKRKEITTAALRPRQFLHILVWQVKDDAEPGTRLVPRQILWNDRSSCLCTNVWENSNLSEQIFSETIYFPINWT